MNEFLEQFLVECRELVEQAAADIMALEADAEDTARLDSAFRAFHTLKGAAGIVEFADMGRAVHAAESALSDVRAGRSSMTTVMASNCLACLDQVADWLRAIEESGSVALESRSAADAVVSRFAAAAFPDGAGNSAASPPAQAVEMTATLRTMLEAQRALLAEPAGDRTDALGRLLSAARTAGAALRHAGRESDAQAVGAALATALPSVDAGPLIALLERLLREEGIAQPAANPAPDVRAGPMAGSGPAARSIRVDVARIDMLVQLCGQLQVADNAIRHLATLAEEEAPEVDLAQRLKVEHARLAQIVGQLQRSVVGIRVLPFREVFQRFPRLVRDMGQGAGKQVLLVTEGEATEADKTIVEGLFEPILHALRNAVDHGIESADERARQGKPAIAVVTVKAERKGSSVEVTVADDGRGIDPVRIGEVALERGLVDRDALKAMPESDLMQLVFRPGFSSASVVTDLSGRGVGMDAIRAAVERLRGTVDIASRPEHGTTLRLALPFSVMMTNVMTVTVGGQQFGIPLGAVMETLRVPPERISKVGHGRAFVHHDRTIPLLNLRVLLNPGAGEPDGPAPSVAPAVVIMMVGGNVVGLEVDGVGERMDVMLSPMTGLLSDIPGVVGTTLLGDGRVLVVLDPESLLD